MGVEVCCFSSVINSDSTAEVPAHLQRAFAVSQQRCSSKHASKGGSKQGAEAKAERVVEVRGQEGLRGWRLVSLAQRGRDGKPSDMSLCVTQNGPADGHSKPDGAGPGRTVLSPQASGK